MTSASSSPDELDFVIDETIVVSPSSSSRFEFARRTGHEDQAIIRSGRTQSGTELVVVHPFRVRTEVPLSPELMRQLARMDEEMVTMDRQQAESLRNDLRNDLRTVIQEQFREQQSETNAVLASLAGPLDELRSVVSDLKTSVDKLSTFQELQARQIEGLLESTKSTSEKTSQLNLELVRIDTRIQTFTRLMTFLVPFAAAVVAVANYLH